MAVMDKTLSALMLTGNFVNEFVSFIVFSILDILDFLLCYTYKVVDFIVEAEWKPCYCSSARKAITSSGNILVSEQGESKKIVCLTSSKLQLEEISDTLYTRSSLVSEVSKTTVSRLKVETKNVIQDMNKFKKGRSTFTINSTIIEMLQGKIGGKKSHPIPRWSDCDCQTCNAWSSSTNDTLFLKAEGPLDNVEEDVLFIHGFISSSEFWTETLFPNFSKSTKSKYRLLAFDLLGFGKSPKPHDSLYTIREHLEMIERSVLEPNNVKSFHIVAHSLGCILALALAVKYPGSVKSLTLIAPPYFPAPKGEQATQYVMRKVAPRRVWPMIAFGASIACWYEYISRTICLLICKNHRIWEFLTKLLTRNRYAIILGLRFSLPFSVAALFYKLSQSSPSQLVLPSQNAGAFGNFCQTQAAGLSGFGGPPGIFGQSNNGQSSVAQNTAAAQQTPVLDPLPEKKKAVVGKRKKKTGENQPEEKKSKKTKKTAVDSDDTVLAEAEAEDAGKQEKKKKHKHSAEEVDILDTEARETGEKKKRKHAAPAEETETPSKKKDKQKKESSAE